MMAEKKEFEGKNLDLAIWQASQELKIPIEEMQYEIVSKGRRGSGGEDGEPARILVDPEGRRPRSAAREGHRPERDRPPARRAAPRPPRRERDLDGGRDRDEHRRRPVEHAEEPEADEDLRTPSVDRDADDADEEELRVSSEDRDADDADEEDLRASSEDRDEDEEDDADDLPPAPGDVDDDDPIEEARRARRARSEPEKEPPHDGPPRDERPRRERPSHRSERSAPRSARPPRDRDRPAPRRADEEDDRPGGVPELEDLESGMSRAREVLPPILDKLGFDLSVDYEIREDHVYVPMEGDDGEYLLGERAEGLNALQLLLNKMVYRGGPTRIVLDVNGYRKERQERLVAEALEVARRVKDSGESHTLDPMNPFERRLVHLALRDDPDVSTFSHGTAFMKQLEIAPKGAERRPSRDRPRRPRRGRYRG